MESGFFPASKSLTDLLSTFTANIHVLLHNVWKAKEPLITAPFFGGIDFDSAF